jgi:hypothetical protein
MTCQIIKNLEHQYTRFVYSKDSIVTPVFLLPDFKQAFLVRCCNNIFDRID